MRGREEGVYGERSGGGGYVADELV